MTSIPVRVQISITPSHAQDVAGEIARQKWILRDVSDQTVMKNGQIIQYLTIYIDNNDGRRARSFILTDARRTVEFYLKKYGAFVTQCNVSVRKPRMSQREAKRQNLSLPPSARVRRGGK